VCLEFAFNLMVEDFDEFFVTGDEGKIQVCGAEHDRIAKGAKLDRAVVVPLEQLLVFWIAYEFNPKRFDLTVGATPPNRQSPRQANVDERVRLGVFLLEEREIHSRLIALRLNSNFLRTGQDLAPGNPVEGIPKIPAACCRNLGRVEALEARLGSQLQAYPRIIAYLVDGIPEREQLGSCCVNFVTLKKVGRQSCPTQYCRNRNISFLQSCAQEG
jgi:hypothetical protein